MTQKLIQDAYDFLNAVEAAAMQAGREEVGGDSSAALAAQRSQYEALLATKQAEYEAGLDAKQSECDSALASQRTSYETQLASQRIQYEAAIASQKREYDAMIVSERSRSYNEGYADAEKDADAQYKKGYDAGYAAHKNETGSNVETPSYTEQLNIPDGTAYKNKELLQAASFLYSRTFSSTNWGTIVLPIALNYSDWCDRFEIAEITGIYRDGSDSFSTNRRILGVGTSIVPNKPYLIRAKKANAKKAQQITKKNCLVYPGDAESVELEFGGNRFVFVGNYDNMTPEELDGCYYASGGKFVKATSKLKPMRAFLELK